MIAYLERVDHAEDLVKRAASLCRIADGETDDLLGVDYKDGTDLGARQVRNQVPSKYDSILLTVNGMPLASTLVGSTASNMS